MISMKTLSQNRFKRTETYIFTHGRELDQQLFNFHFMDGSLEAALDALVDYQNSDGGFGHALEPDLRTPASSVIATSMAFSILREVKAPGSFPLVKQGIEYLLNTFDEEKRGWPIIPPEAEDAPRAFWWEYGKTEENFGGFLINPRAVVLGYLYDYIDLVPADFLAEVTQEVLDYLLGVSDEMAMYDFLSLKGLAASSNLPEEIRKPVVEKLTRIVPHVLDEQEKWAGHGVSPLDIASWPEGVLAGAVSDEDIQVNLDMVIEHQNPDGTWELGWSWEALDAEAWAQAEKDWKGHAGVRQLVTLRAFGRLDS